jgi:hypothetical protein
MGLFDFLKSKKDNKAVERPHLETGISDADLKTLIGKAIKVFEDKPGANADAIIKGIESHIKNEDLAVALYRFIPIAFCRVILPEPAYSDEYIIADKKNGNKTYSFSSDKVFTTVLNESRAYLATEPDRQRVVNVLVQSADFDAINKALHGGSELKDLEFGPSYFL